MRPRTYYDHEPAYREIAARGGKGWDDRRTAQGHDSYEALEAFLRSPLCPTAPSACRALEVGCGGGQASLRLARAGFAVEGVDFSETAIAMARANANAAGVDVRFEVGDALGLAKFASAAFDLVVDNHLLHCIVGPSDRRRVLGSMHRVLRPSGVLFLDTMSAEGRFEPGEIGVDASTRVDALGRRYWVRSEELKDELRQVGFHILDFAVRPQPEDELAAGDMLTVVASPGRSSRGENVP